MGRIVPAVAAALALAALSGLAVGLALPGWRAALGGDTPGDAATLGRAGATAPPSPSAATPSATATALVSAPPTPFPLPTATAMPSASPPRAGVSAFALPRAANTSLSPDGRYIEVNLPGEAIYDAQGRRVAEATGLASISTTYGWLGDSSGTLFAGSRAHADPARGQRLFVLRVGGGLVELPLGQPEVSPHGLPRSTSDGDWIAVAVAERTVRLVATDGSGGRDLVTASEPVLVLGWIDDQRLAYREGADRLRLVDRQGRVSELSAPGLPRTGFMVVSAPDGTAALLAVSGPSTPIGAAAIADARGSRPLAIDMYFGWSGPHELVARRGDDLVVIDLATGTARRVLDGVGTALSFPLFAAARGPYPFGAGVRDGLVCWKNSEPVMSVVDLATGRRVTVAGTGTVYGAVAGGRCIANRPDGGGYEAIDMRAVLAR
ncbi:MAG TPA: hypothetical protein VFM93_01425 [Candidatus Limnocylindria bacterium]|nr:hypothetical protein [Candidatus Limnocylindria bacterium]